MVSPNHYPQLPKKRRFNSDSENCCVMVSHLDNNSHSSTSSPPSFNFLNNSRDSCPLSSSSLNSQFHESKNNEIETFWRPWNDEKKRNSSYMLTFASATLEQNIQSSRYTSPSGTNDRQTQKCKLCPQDFTRRDNLARHMRSKHNLNSRPECRFCFKMLSRTDAVQRHELSCHHNKNRITHFSQTQNSLNPVTRY